MLFRAAIAAFAALPRPTRAEISRLDDLVMPLIEQVSPESRLYAASTLADRTSAPPRLVRALACDLPDIAEPLLARSPVLSELDLIVVIARGGRPHARIMARRPDLPPAIRNLLAMLRDPEIAALGIEAGTPAPTGKVFDTLRNAALDDDDGKIGHSLARLLGITAAEAAALCERQAQDELLTAFIRLSLTTEQAFLILAAMHPQQFGSRSAIRKFLATYDALAGDSGSIPGKVALPQDFA